MKYFEINYNPLYFDYMKYFKKIFTIFGLHEVFRKTLSTIFELHEVFQKKNYPLYLGDMNYLKQTLSTIFRLHEVVPR